MEGYEFLLVLPPLLAIGAAWLNARAIKKSAAEIDRIRDALHVAKERQMELDLQRQSPPVESSAPMRPTPVMR